MLSENFPELVQIWKLIHLLLLLFYVEDDIVFVQMISSHVYHKLP